MTSSSTWQFCIDRGGTFTDIVARSPDGRLLTHKLLSENPEAYADAATAGIADLLGITRGSTLPTELIHSVKMGTTVATNALLERKGARVALLTTEGHRDVVEMREGLKPDRYDLRSPPPEPLVPRERRFGVRERLKADGSASITLDAASLGAAIAAVRQSGATSVADRANDRRGRRVIQESFRRNRRSFVSGQASITSSFVSQPRWATPTP